MAQARKVGSNAKRAVVYKRPNEPRPVQERAARINRRGKAYFTSIDPVQFYLTGQPNKGDGYTDASSGLTLSDYVAQHSTYTAAKRKAAKEFAERNFRSQETLLNWLDKHGFFAYPNADGIIVSTSNTEGTWGLEESLRQSRANDAWLKGEVYGVALVDDPEDDTGSTLYVDHPRDVPGKIIKRQKAPIYGRDKAFEVAEKNRQNIYDNPEDYYFEVRQLWPSQDVPASVAKVLGYDGRKMKIGEEVRIGNCRFTRTQAPVKPKSSQCLKKKPTTAKSKAKTKPKQGSAQRKPNAPRRR